MCVCVFICAYIYMHIYIMYIYVCIFTYALSPPFAPVTAPGPPRIISTAAKLRQQPCCDYLQTKFPYQLRSSGNYACIYMSDKNAYICH